MKKILGKPGITLTIAGSDSGGGAGIQADIKTISSIGAYATSVITAITAQNTVGVQKVQPVSSKLLATQLKSVFEDFKIDSVKIGMLCNPNHVNVVVRALKQYEPKSIVLDPVIVSSSGTFLSSSETMKQMMSSLFPLCDLITPNFDEICLILSICEDFKTLNLIKSQRNKKNFLELLEKSTYKICTMYSCDVIVTGICLKKFNNKFSSQQSNYNSDLVDLLNFENKLTYFYKKKISSRNTHGTGCSFSSAIAAKQALGEDIINSISFAQSYVNKSIKHAQKIRFGKGTGPVNHFFSPSPLATIN